MEDLDSILDEYGESDVLNILDGVDRVEDVVFIARGEHLQTMCQHGLKVDSIKGDFVLEQVQATDDPKKAGVVDAILVGVKAGNILEAAKDMLPMVGPTTFVVPLQNGVEAPSQLAATIGGMGVDVRFCPEAALDVQVWH